MHALREATVMTLAFPNPSRNFDKARNAIRFTGYDGMFEVPFFVETSALGQSGAEPRSEDVLETASFQPLTHCVRPSMMLRARRIPAAGAPLTF